MKTNTVYVLYCDNNSFYNNSGILGVYDNFEKAYTAMMNYVNYYNYRYLEEAYNYNCVPTRLRCFTRENKPFYLIIKPYNINSFYFNY